MSRHILSLSHEQLTACDLDAFVRPCRGPQPAQPGDLHHAVSQSAEPVALSLSNLRPIPLS